MSRVISCDELVSSGLLNRITDGLMQFTVGFVKLVDDVGGKEDMQYAGSGTLVKTRGQFAILTADHVLQNQTRNKIGLTFPGIKGSNPHRFFLNIDESQKLRIGPSSDNPEGPDLGLLLLHNTDAVKIEVYKAFYNLSNRCEQMRQPRSVDAGGWFLCGGVDEWTTDGQPEHPFTKVKVFRGLCGAGVVGIERADEQFDYLDFEVAVNEQYEGPLSFKGVSGGGLWQVVLKDHEGEVEIADSLLSGVAYYQIILDGKPQKVICHGRRSIYETVVGVLETNAS